MKEKYVGMGMDEGKHTKREDMKGIDKTRKDKRRKS